MVLEIDPINKSGYNYIYPKKGGFGVQVLDDKLYTPGNVKQQTWYEVSRLFTELPQDST